MKKVLACAACVFVLALTLVSCAGNGPKANAEKFLNGVYHLDYAAAKEVSTDWTRKQLEAYEQLLTVMPENAKAEAKKIRIDIKSSKVVGDTATIDYIVSVEPKSTKTIKMIKQNGKWLAEFSKNPTDNFGSDMFHDAPNDMSGPTSAIDTQWAPPADGTAAPTMDSTIH